MKAVAPGVKEICVRDATEEISTMRNSIFNIRRLPKALYSMTLNSIRPKLEFSPCGRILWPP